MNKKRYFSGLLACLTTVGLLAVACNSDFPEPAQSGSYTRRGVRAVPVTWTQTALTSGKTVNKVSYGKEKFIATGWDSSLAWSPDGEIWISLPEPDAFKNGTAVQSMHHYFGGDWFVASAGSSGQRAWAASSNGQTWMTTGTLSDNFNAKGGVYGNEYYCISGSSGRIAYATDPLGPWDILLGSDTTFNAGGPGSFINAMAFGNGVFVAGGGSGHIAWTMDSPDTGWAGSTGTDGTVEEIFDGGFVNSIAFGNGYFVAVGGQDTGPGKAASSSDGKKWTESFESLPIGVNAKITAVAYGAGVFVLADNKGDAAYSTDGGNSWTKILNTTFNATETSIESVCFGNEMFILAGANGQIAYSIPE